MKATFATFALALVGSASAQYTNSSSSAVAGSSTVDLSSSTSSASATSSSGPTYTNGAEPTVNGVKFDVQEDTTYQGTPLTLMRKRDRGTNLNQCVNTCASDSRCVGTSFTDSTSECSYFSGISAQPISSPGTDFAKVTARDGVPVTPSGAVNGTSSTASVSRSMGSGSSSKLTYSNSTASSTGSLSRSRSVAVSASATSGSISTASRSRSSASSSATSTAVPSFQSIGGVRFKIEIDITYDGITFDIELALAKRAGQDLNDCLVACAADERCKGTAFDSNDDTCTFYSEIDTGSRQDAPGVTFATVESRANNGTSSSSTVPSNSTTSTQSSASATATGLESFICPKLNGDVITNAFGAAFAIECGHGLIGTTMDIEESRKRQATGLPTSLSNCVDLCSTNDECTATTFNNADGTCAFYSAFTATVVAANLDSALRVGVNPGPDATQTVTVVTTQVQTSTVFIGNGQSTIQTGAVTQTSTLTICPTCSVTAVPSNGVVGGSLSTATVYSTTVVTISSCAPTVTDCPLRAGQNNAVITTVVPVSETVYVCPLPTQNANVVTALYGAVTEKDVVTSTVYECPAGKTITVSGTQMVPAQPTTITEYYTTHITQSASGTPPVMTGDNASKSVVYVQQVVSVCPTCPVATQTSYVVVSTAPPAPQQTTATITLPCDGVHCPAATTGASQCNGAGCPVTTTYKVTINTVIPQPSSSAASQCNGANCPAVSTVTKCNGVNCPATTPASSGMSTSAYATATVSKPIAFTGAGSVVSIQGGVVAIVAAAFSIFMF